MEKLLHTPVEAADLLNISRSQVYILMNQGLLKSVHIGRSRRITTTQIQEFIDSLTKEAS